MKKVLYFFILLFFGISQKSCEKGDVQDVFAGKKDNLYYFDLKPDIEITSLNPSYSININNDLVIDFIFGQVSVPTSSGFMSVPTIKNTKNFQIMISEIDNLPEALEYNEPIKLSNNWSNVNDTLFLLVDHKEGPGGSYPLYGSWLNTENKYLGIKLNNKLGWIKMSNLYLLLKKIVIKEYAIQN